MKLRPLFRKRDKSGQATTEYVMLMVVLVVLIITIGLAFSKKIKDLIEGRLGNIISGFFNPNTMHTLPFRIPK